MDPTGHQTFNKQEQKNLYQSEDAAQKQENLLLIIFKHLQL
jgi:hypothetical protein